MIDFVEVPEDLYPVLGKPDEGSRIYRKDGPNEECGAWFEAVYEFIGSTVSPGGVAMYCPVSRAAVHKRIKEGKLSIFLYHTTHQKTTFWGKRKNMREAPYGLVPVAEVRQWRKELEQRALLKGSITEKELEGMKPDWAGDFMDWRKKSERHKRGVLLEQMGLSDWRLFIGDVAATFKRDD